jgi:indole-3-glycerol phosphate synthase
LARAAVNIPLLRKEFIVDVSNFRSQRMVRTLILLIAAVLTLDEIKTLSQAVD